MRIVLQIILWMFPWPIRSWILQHCLGFQLAEGVRIGFSIILADVVKIGRNSAIRNFTVIKNLDQVILGDNSYILNLNWITGTKSNDLRHFRQIENRRCELLLGNHTSITSRHFIDCTGGIEIGEYTTIGGAQSQILTHYIDPYECKQTCKRIEIGRYCFIGTRALLLPGSGLPDYSILGGGSVLTKKYGVSRMLYAGNPAIPKKDMSQLTVGYFSRLIGAVE